NGISLPIQLEYDAGGVRVNQQPGWVGQNWKLNAGGAVVRSMKGSPDEEGFFLNASYQNSRNAYFTVVLDGQFLTEAKTDTESELRQFAIDRFFTNNKTSDTEPDIFSFSLPDGRSGKFFLATDTTWKVISDHNFRIAFDITDTTNYLNPPFSEVPGSDGQQIYEKTIEGFKILDDMGNQFTFGFHPEAIEYSLPFFSQTHDQPFYPNWMANTWYLTEIKDYLGNNAYSLSYQRDYFTGQLTHGPLVRNFECRLANGNWLNPTNAVSPEYSGSLISPVYLSAITNIEGQSLGFYRTNVTEIDTSLNIDKVEAQYDDVIDKVCPGGCTDTQPLPFLQESGYYSFNPTAALLDPFQGLKRKKLEQLFIYQNSQLLFGVKLKYNDVTDKRLRLDSVMVMDNTFPFNGAAMSHCYVLEYDDFDQLPGYLSNNVDHYGYNRGQPYSYATAIGTYSNAQWDSLGLAHFNSRTSDFTFAKIGSLKKIIYPHGGRSELEYELHNYSQVLSDDRQSLVSESGSIGGLRIKNIRDYKDQLTSIPTTIKSYKYILNYASGGNTSSGVLGLKPKYHWVDWLSPTDEHPSGGYREDVFSVNNMLPMSNFFEAHIAYPEVTEVVNDSFYMTHKYTSHMEIKDELPYATLTFNQFSPYLNYNDKSFMRGKLKESLYFDKSNALVKKDQVYYHMDAIVSEDYGITCSAGFTYSCSPVIFDDKVYKGSANRIYFQKFYVDSSRSAQYFAGDSITQSIAFSYVQPSFYGNNYLFKNVETTNNSDGKNHSQISNYVFQPGIAPSGQQTFYDQLVTAHRLEPPVVVAKLVGINVVDGQRILFNTFNTKILPAGTQRYEYTWDVNQTGSGTWVDHQNILSYNNTFITPISVQAKGFQANSLSLNPRGKALSNQYLTHTTSFSYNALDLLQQETAVDGTYSTYSYDLFSRVKERTLLPINATQRTRYHYAESASDKSFIRHTSHFVPVADSGLDSIPTISYIDGLARTEQSIDIGGGSVPTQDVVAPMTYDF
ncbi:MAG TPA: hypothetical protein PLY70_16770, partial [Saprospiraceae bacterium]|nr:hypothetical protein [Saprospiraceae bacterium]